MIQRSGRPTIKDVAKAAGVSLTTVSHALNGKGSVRQSTRDRVAQIAHDIGYHPNPIARGLQNSKLGLLALVLRPLDSLDSFLPGGVEYFPRMVGAASLAAMEWGYSLMLVDDPSKPGAPPSATAADAYIISEPFENDPALTMLTARHIPVVSIGADPARPGQFIELESHDFTDAMVALEHLRNAGAHRVGMVTGTDRNAWNTESRRAYFEWCKKYQKEPLITSFPEAAGEQIGNEALDFFERPRIGEAPDAVFCMTGRHAAGLLTAALEHGYRVPADLMIVGGSGALQNRISSPTVTTLDLHPELTAQRAVELAVAVAEGRTIPPNLSSPHATLTVRESTMRAK